MAASTTLPIPVSKATLSYVYWDSLRDFCTPLSPSLLFITGHCWLHQTGGNVSSSVGSSRKQDETPAQPYPRTNLFLDSLPVSWTIHTLSTPMTCIFPDAARTSTLGLLPQFLPSETFFPSYPRNVMGWEIFLCLHGAVFPSRLYNTVCLCIHRPVFDLTVCLLVFFSQKYLWSPRKWTLLGKVF